VLQHFGGTQKVSGLASLITAALKPTKFADRFGLRFSEFLQQRAQSFVMTTPSDTKEPVVSLTLGARFRPTAPTAASAGASPAAAGSSHSDAELVELMSSLLRAGPVQTVKLGVAILKRTGATWRDYTRGHHGQLAAWLLRHPEVFSVSDGKGTPLAQVSLQPMAGTAAAAVAAPMTKANWKPVASEFGNGSAAAAPSSSSSSVTAEQVEAACVSALKRAIHPLQLNLLASIALTRELRLPKFPTEFGGFKAFLLQRPHLFTVRPGSEQPLVSLAKSNGADNALPAADGRQDGSGLAADLSSLKLAPEQASSAASVSPAVVSSPVMSSRTVAVLVHGAGSAKGIRCRVESVAVLRSELAALLEERELPQLPEGVRFSSAAEADAEGNRAELVDAELWTLVDGTAVYVLPPPPPKAVRVFMPPSFSEAPVQCAADQLADLLASLGEQLQAAGGRLFDERVHFSVTQPTPAAPSPAALTAADYAALAADSALFAVFEWCPAPLSVQRMLLAGAELDMESTCRICSRVLAHQAHLKPVN